MIDSLDIRHPIVREWQGLALSFGQVESLLRAFYLTTETESSLRNISLYKNMTIDTVQKLKSL
jgi:hypothetical protein